MTRVRSRSSEHEDADEAMKPFVSIPWIAFLATAPLAAALPAQEPIAPRDDPAAHALYDRMLATLRGARTLSWTSDYRWLGEGALELGRCTYAARLAKPNRFRIDTIRSDGKKGGVLVGDGDELWMHWPNGRPFFSTEDPATRDEPRDNDYLQQAAPPGGHSIAHETGFLGAGMSMTVINPSAFHGCADSMQPHLDGVSGRGTAVAPGGEECDVVVASFMNGQRTRELWLARRDCLPRYLREVVHVRFDIVTEETWSNVEIDAELPAELFAWAPPDGWRRWFKPDAEDRLLQPGEVAPDFELRGRGGGVIRLSALRGKVVWLNFWRVG
jgi:hypothetical protein